MDQQGGLELGSPWSVAEMDVRDWAKGLQSEAGQWFAQIENRCHRPACMMGTSTTTNNTTHKSANFFVCCLVGTASAVDHGGRQRQRRSKAARATAQTVLSARTSERRDGPVREEAPHLTRSEERHGQGVGRQPIHTERSSNGSGQFGRA